ncbi:hypothetical protein REJC140_01734 [Pseudorhizobium endolithicum]|uniref:Uncharacterized protein n=1 Tax=Pseudorhizobium endolithicum TaxID=1191678 RepID=A0ABN7JXW0_9HYPH|nr:hypothetical protein [Pseudorhizobium endolithicum]CAD7051488.1 hypothetical protein REJC140_01734 [Pseudorhizobium endolithicum]
MKGILSAAAMGILLSAAVAGPSQAEQSELSAFLFGRHYDDGVTAIPIIQDPSEDERHPSYFLYPARMRVAQQIVTSDPSLLDALARRNIAVYNVLWVRTAANGGRIVYYR